MVIATVGVAISLMVMEITLAIVSGFKEQIKEKIIGFEAEISVGAPYDYQSGAVTEFVSMTARLDSLIRQSCGREGSLSLQIPSILKTDDNFAGIVMTAYDSNHDEGFQIENMIEGEFPDYEDENNDNRIVISSVLSKELGLSPGDRVYSCFFVNDGMKMRRHEVAGIYESNIGEYDKTIVYASLRGLRNIAEIDDNSGSRIEIAGFREDEIEDKASELQQNLHHAVQTGELDKLYPVTTVFQTGAQYFNWLSLLDTNVIVIFVLMLSVACFTLVSSLYLIVLDKIQTIGLLRAVGASRRLVSKIFAYMGMRLVGLGLAAGNLLGVGICLLQQYTHVLSLDPQMYYLKYVPIRIDPIEFVMLNAGVAVISWLVLYIPSRSASKLDPTQSLRFD